MNHGVTVLAERMAMEQQKWKAMGIHEWSVEAVKELTWFFRSQWCKPKGMEKWVEIMMTGYGDARY